MDLSRKRRRSIRFEDEFTPKKQCTLNFVPEDDEEDIDISSNENYTNIPAPNVKKNVPKQKKAPRKKKNNKKSVIQPLSFIVTQKPNPPKIKNEENAKLFNQIVQAQASSEETTTKKLHPFFAAKATRTSATTTSSKKDIRTKGSSKKNIYDISQAMPPVHILQNNSIGTILSPSHLITDFNKLTIENNEEWYENSMQECNSPNEWKYLVPPSFNISEIEKMNITEQNMLETTENEEEVHTHIPLELYLQQLKLIQEQLLKRYEKSCAHLFLNDIQLLELFRGGYYQKSSEQKSEASLWTERFKPVRNSDYFSSPNSGNQLYSWLYSWKQYTADNTNQSAEMNQAQQMMRSYKAFILHSQQPIGKSSLIYCLAKEMEMKVLEINGSDLRNKRLLRSLEEATQSHHLALHDTKTETSEEHKVILFEDVDIRNADEGSFYPSLLSLIEHTKQPIVMTCSNLPDEIAKNSLIPVLIQNLEEQNSPIRKYCLERHLLLICLAEFRCFPSINSLLELCFFLEHDQRKILHCLQFWNRSTKQDQLPAKENLLQLSLGISSLNAKREEFPLHVTSLSFSTLKDTKLCSSFPISAFNNINKTDDEQSNLKKQYEQMKLISTAYDSFGVSDILSSAIPVEQQFPYSDNSCIFKRQTDFKLSSEEEVLSTEHLFSNFQPQGDSLMEQICIYSYGLSTVHYIPDSFDLNETLQIDLESVSAKRQTYERHVNKQTFLKKLLPRYDISPTPTKIDITSSLQLICSLENERLIYNTKRRFLHHLNTYLPTDMCKRIAKSSVPPYFSEI